MLVTHELNIDLTKHSRQPEVAAVQGEANTRQLAISLFSNSIAWEIPNGATAAVAFLKPDGTKGLYDKLPDGTEATAMSGNTVNAILAPQALTCAGIVLASVIFYKADGDTLATFPFRILVAQNPAAGEQISNDYYSPSIHDLDQAIKALEEQVEALDPDTIKDVIRHSPQELADEQKEQARENIGAASKEDLEILDFMPPDGNPEAEVRFDAVHAQMMTALEFVIADPENPFGSIMLTKAGAAEDEGEPKNIAVLQKATGEPVILRGIETPTDPLDAVNLQKLVEYYHLLKQYADGKSVNVSHGKLGQHLAVAAVNQDGEITGWKVEDPPTFGFRHIRTVTIPEDITTDTSGVAFAEAEKGGVLFGFDRDKDGKPFALKEFFFQYSAGSPTESTGNIAFANWATPGYNNSMGFGVNRKLGTNGSKNSGNIYFCNKFILYNSASGAGAATLEPCLSTRLDTFTAFSCYHHGVSGLGFAPGSTFTLYGR